MAEIVLPILLILVILGALNIPIYLAILAATAYIQVFIINVPMTGIFNSLIESLAKSSFLCVPFFILTGSLIQSSSLGTRLIDFFVAILRNIRGGLAIACLVSNAFFGAISGSAPAAVATFGKIVYEPLKDEEGDNLAVGLLASSGALSTIIPPSITLIIYGLATETSVARLFMAGFVPGLLIVVLVGAYLVWHANKRMKATSVQKVITYEDVVNSETKIIDNRQLGKAFVRGIPVLILPVIILGSIYGGYATPTEAGAIAALYSFIVPKFVLKEIKMKQLPAILKDGARITAQLFILITCSTAFAQATTMARLPQMLTESFASMNMISFLLMLNILLLIVGCFFDPSAAVLILAPLLLPTARNLGIDPVHLGIIFSVNLSIGMFTPPFGLNIYVVQSVLRKSMGMIVKALVPFIILYIIGLLIITYIPQISLILPSLLM